MLKMTSKKIALLSSVLLIGACAYYIDDSTQDVTFLTPGAYDAHCNVYVNKTRYSVRPPQTINLYNSKEGIVADCKAPGNRHKIVEISAKLAQNSAWNAVNAGAGLPIDYFSGALFKYPDTIEIDFTDLPVAEFALPAQNNPDIKQPEEYPLENFSPSKPRLNSDANKTETKILRRGETIFEDDGVYRSDAFYDAPTSGGKGSLQDTVGESLPPVSDPVPLIPGE